MSKRAVESKAGAIYGTYEGDSAREAFLAMLDDYGDASVYGAAHVGTESDWIIKPAPDRA
jgi:hypothetical protein